MSFIRLTNRRNISIFRQKHIGLCRRYVGFMYALCMLETNEKHVITKVFSHYYVGM